MGKKIYVGDTGTELILDTNEDIGGATVSIRVRKGDGTVTEWTSTTYGAIPQTKVRHIMGADDLSCSGIYRVQAHVQLTSGWTGLGETAEFQVYSAFD